MGEVCIWEREVYSRSMIYMRERWKRKLNSIVNGPILKIPKHGGVYSITHYLNWKLSPI